MTLIYANHCEEIRGRFSPALRRGVQRTAARRGEFEPLWLTLFAWGSGPPDSPGDRAAISRRDFPINGWFKVRRAAHQDSCRGTSAPGRLGGPPDFLT